MNRKKTETIFKFKLAVVWMFIMAAIMAELLVYTWSRVQCVKIGYEITQASHRYREQVALQKAMEIELALLTSPERVTQQAREVLHLVMPSPQQVVTIP
jgi:hypothetical protein